MGQGKKMSPGNVSRKWVREKMSPGNGFRKCVQEKISFTDSSFTDAISQGNAQMYGPYQDSLVKISHTLMDRKLPHKKTVLELLQKKTP